MPPLRWSAWDLLNRRPGKDGRQCFTGAKLDYTSGRAPLKLYARGSSKEIASLEGPEECTLSPEGHTLAVMLKTGVLLIDVDASLAAGKLTCIPGAAR